MVEDPLVRRARVFSSGAHSKQMRKFTKEPHFLHTYRVAMLVKFVGGSPLMIAAAYLHDILEDTKHTSSDLEEEFGHEVSGLVIQLTNPSKEAGNRVARHLMNLQRFQTASVEALTIKLADIIDNLPSMVQHNPGFARTYLEEKKGIFKIMETRALPEILLSYGRTVLEMAEVSLRRYGELQEMIEEQAGASL